MQTPKKNDAGSASPATPPAAKARRIWPKLLTFVFIVGFAIMALKLLPRGYSQDFSLIGKGGNVMVLVHDHNVVGSMETMHAMDQVRDEYEGRVKFLVADKFSPEGMKFTDTYKITAVSLIMFAPNGEMVNVLYAQQDADSLRKALNATFHLD